MAASDAAVNKNSTAEDVDDAQSPQQENDVSPTTGKGTRNRCPGKQQSPEKVGVRSLRSSKHAQKTSVSAAADNANDGPPPRKGKVTKK